MNTKSVLANTVVRLLLGGALLASACQTSVYDPETGGETHFLKSCSPSDNDCGPSLACVCGVCTLGCDDQAACASLTEARCMSNPNDICGGNTTPHCDVECSQDVDCQNVSAFHVCDNGVCRTRGPELPNLAEANTPATSEPSDAGEACSMSDTSPNELLIMGDTFFAGTHQVTGYLEELARESGLLASGERYRDVSRVVANTLSVAGNGIEQQFLTAIQDGPVRHVVMNGGGADALLATCEMPEQTCPALLDAASAAEALFTNMAANGVGVVVYAYYPDPVEGALKTKLDALRPLIQAACESAPLKCHWLDLRAAFAGNSETHLTIDGALPTAIGSKVTADSIWSVMSSECIAH